MFLCLLLLVPHHPHGSGLFLPPQVCYRLGLSFFLFIVLLSRTYFTPSLFDAVFSVALPSHDRDHAIIDLSSLSAETGRHVMDRYAANISMNIPLPNEIRRKVGVDDDGYREPKTLPTLFLTAPVSS